MKENLPCLDASKYCPNLNMNEGRVDSVAIDQLLILSKANCTFLAYGAEAGTQKILDRLNIDLTLEQIEYAVSEAEGQGIERGHGFFPVGSPGETQTDMVERCRLAAHLKLGTFGFNRLCVCRGTLVAGIYLSRNH
jgi:radical SAM superfamily enzyme YgiQ (UPF0313 family)